MEILARNSIIQIKDGWIYRKETQKSKHLDLKYAERSHIVLRNSLHGLAFGLLPNRKFSNNTDGYFTSINLSPIAPNLVFCSLFSFEYKTSSKTISHKKTNSFFHWQKTGILLSAHIIISFMTLLLLFFHGKVFGRLRHPSMSLSLFGSRIG